MQTVNENECRWLYDQLTPLTPVFLALSAASPIFKSILSDLDCRWEALSAVSSPPFPSYKQSNSSLLTTVTVRSVVSRP